MVKDPDNVPHFLYTYLKVTFRLFYSPSRFLYCLHAVNHSLKTRLKVIHHNARLTDRFDIPDEFRDQGLVRPKVLIVAPFKDSALRIVRMITSILLSDECKANVINKKRFYDEFSGEDGTLPRKNPHPTDFEKTFVGKNEETDITLVLEKKYQGPPLTMCFIACGDGSV